MSGFSPDWLALREPVDHRSRDRALAARLAAHFQGRDEVAVVDLGCGAGSNIRATSLLLPERQSWTLVDYDARLLEAARARLAAWADEARSDGDALVLSVGPRRLRVRFASIDLQTGLGQALAGAPDLVTASALFDLCSADFIDRFAAAVAPTGAAFYTVLTYNGIQSWTPPHAADAAMAAAFHAHQRIDKGFGAAAGPGAPAALARAFAASGMRVAEGDSPWVLGAADASLIHDLAAGFADAVAETNAVAAADIAAWRAILRSGAVVGHTDTLAFAP
ncbi:MAG: SAM-dependent methyltransferase [Hyphomicrobiaceae bacterium]